jgi:hypothetical protein
LSDDADQRMLCPADDAVDPLVRVALGQSNLTVM